MAENLKTLEESIAERELGAGDVGTGAGGRLATGGLGSTGRWRPPPPAGMGGRTGHRQPRPPLSYHCFVHSLRLS